MIIIETRVDNRIPAEIKERADKELAARGLSISGFIRMTLSSVAKGRFPKCWGIPNVETTASIEEAVGDMNGPKLKGAPSFEELESMLSE